MPVGYLRDNLWIREVPSEYTTAQIRAYLEKVGCESHLTEEDIQAKRFPRSPETLAQVVLRHLLTFPWDNTAMHYTADHHMDVSALGVYNIFMNGGRGSYCFGQNTMLLNILRGLGFRAYSGAARVNLHWSKAGEPPAYASHTHMVLFVQPEDDSNQTYVVDVGFGSGVGPTEMHRLAKAAMPQSALDWRALLYRCSTAYSSPAPPPAPPPASFIPDDALAMLLDYDTVFLIDDSSTMSERAKRGFLQRKPGKSPWELARYTAVRFGKEAALRDADGIDIHFINYQPDAKGAKNTRLRTEEEITSLFDHISPGGHTHIGRRLVEITAEYRAQLESCHKMGIDPPKRRNYIIITDGAPNKKPPQPGTWYCNDIYAISLLANLPLPQLGFQFVQVGDDPKATRYLNYLDTSAKFSRDIVDTVKSKDSSNKKFKLRGLFGTDNSEESDLFEKILLGGISRTHDQRGDVKVKYP
ncbi:hypothetical protein NMY22_g7948 [Coprinellus aureogranulatus]|nr:hypothetical protein NMY22_g7948 [Coprinellus aureogranulatus]